MPKIIENLAQDILREARKIIEIKGLEALNVRSLSASLGIAPSTLYNYYRNKDEIIGALLQNCWDEAMIRIDGECGGKTVAEALTFTVAELRKTVKPVIHLHLASAEGGSTVSDLKSGHAVDAQKKMIRQLQERLKTVFEQEPKDCADIDGTVTVMTKLVMACVHDDTLNIEDIIRTVKNI